MIDIALISGFHRAESFSLPVPEKYRDFAVFEVHNADIDGEIHPDLWVVSERESGFALIPPQLSIHDAELAATIWLASYAPSRIRALILKARKRKQEFLLQSVA